MIAAGTYYQSFYLSSNRLLYSKVILVIGTFEKKVPQERQLQPHDCISLHTLPPSWIFENVPERKDFTYSLCSVYTPPGCNHSRHRPMTKTRLYKLCIITITWWWWNETNNKENGKLIIFLLLNITTLKIPNLNCV